MLDSFTSAVAGVRVVVLVSADGLLVSLSVNCFDGVARHHLDDVRDALQISDRVPLRYTDARSRGATKQALIALVQHAMARHPEA